MQPFRRVAHVVERSDPPAAQRLCFRNIRCDDEDARQEFDEQDLNPVGVEQRACRSRMPALDPGRRAAARDLRWPQPPPRRSPRCRACRSSWHGCRRRRPLRFAPPRDRRPAARRRTPARVLRRHRRVIAVAPRTPSAAKVRRSACRPARPLESLPAIVSALTHTLRSHVMPTTFLDVMLARAGEDRAFRTLQRAVAVVFVTVLTIAAAQISIPASVHAGSVHLPADGGPGRCCRARRAVGRPARCSTSRSASPACPCSPPRRSCRRALPGCWGPTGGYLLAHSVAAFIAGRLGERGLDRRYFTAVAAMLRGLRRRIRGRRFVARAGAACQQNRG